MDCFESEQQDIQEICYSLAHTKALSTIRGEEEGYNSPPLVSQGLQEGPVKNPVQKIQNTLTSWGRNI